MEILQKFKKNLEKLIFIELKEGAYIGKYKLPEPVFVAIRSGELMEKVKKGDDMKEIPTSILFEGMYYLLGADEDFRFNSIYIELLRMNEEAGKFIKNKIFGLIKEEKYEESLIFLLGLSRVEETKDVYEKILHVVDKLRVEDKIYEPLEEKIIRRAKGFGGFSLPNLYESLIERDKGDFPAAMRALHKYLELGGVEDKDITEYKQNLLSILDYDKGVELSISEPAKSLEIMLPLMPVLGNTADYFYHVAVAYRNLENFEKAIYYLNEAFAIDKRLLEVYNEYGINYSALGDFDKAIQYFEKAFEQSESIELATNITLCHINMGDMNKAKEMLEKAEKIDPNDEIVIQLKEYYRL